MDAISGVLALLIAALGGGLLARVLEHWSVWRDLAWSRNVKNAVVYLLTVALAGLLTAVQTYFLPQWYQGIPEGMRVILEAIAMYVMSQKVHELDGRDAYERAISAELDEF